MKRLFEGRYSVVRPLGKGGFGEVLLVEDHLHAGEKRALKIIDGALDSEQRQLFENEFQVLTELSHPHIARVFDFGVLDDDRLYFTTEYVDGVDPNFWLASRNDFTELLRLTVQLCQALRYLHSRNVIHFDIKPANLMIKTVDGGSHLMLLDFGISLELGRIKREEAFGTPNYMAPELIRSEVYDHRLDLFSLGATLYKLATGQTAFPGANADQVFDKILKGEWDRKALSNVPEEFGSIIERLLEADPFDRFQSAAAVIEKINSAFATHFSLETRETKRSYIQQTRLLRYEDRLEELLTEISSRKNELYGFIVEAPFGCGKSRFLSEVRTRLQQCGFKVSLIDTAEISRHRSPTDTLLRLVGIECSVIQLETGELATGSREAMESDRFRRFERYKLALDTLLSEEDVALLIDNIDQADEFTLRFVQFLINTYQGDPTLPHALVIALSRATSTENAPQFSDFRLEQLGPLEGNAAVREFVQHLLGVTHFPNRLVHQIAKVSEGNPYSIKELLNMMIESGQLFTDDGDIVADSADIDQELLPESLAALFASRIRFLPRNDLDLLERLAIFTQGAPIELLTAFSALDRDAVVAILRRNFERGIVAWTPDDPIVQFHHHGYREAVYASIPHPRKIQWHKELFTSLHGEPNFELSAFNRTAEIADQCVLAELGGLAFDYLLYAGREYRKLLNPKIALRYYQRALAIKRTPELLTELSEVYAETGQFRLAIESLSEVIEYYDERSPESLRATLQMATYYKDGSMFREALECVEQMRRRWGDRLTLADELRIANVELPCLLSRYDNATICEKGERLLDRAASDLSLSSRDEQFGILNLNLDVGQAYNNQNRLAEAATYLEMALKLARTLGVPSETAKALTRLAIVNQKMAEYSTASSHLTEALILAQTHGLLAAEVRISSNLAKLCQQLGNIEGALLHYSEASKAAKRFDLHVPWITCELNILHQELELGLPRSAMDRAKEVYARAQRHSLEALQTRTLYFTAEAHRALQEFEEAALLCSRALEELSRGGSAIRRYDVLLTLAEIDLEQGNVDRMGRHVEELKANAESALDNIVIELMELLTLVTQKKSLGGEDLRISKLLYALDTLDFPITRLSQRELQLTASYCGLCFAQIADRTLDAIRHSHHCKTRLNQILMMIPERYHKSFLSRSRIMAMTAAFMPHDPKSKGDRR